MSKRLVVTLLVMLTAVTARAQDLSGQWQGTLQGPRELRFVIKLAADNSGMRAMLYSIDQTSQGLAGAVTAQGRAIKIAVPALNGNYDGTLSADGNTITGTFTQAGTPAPLNLVRASADTAWSIPTPPPAMRPLPATATPKVQLSTVKPSDPATRGRSITFRGRNVVASNTPVITLMVFAYNVHPKQIVGTPAWAETDLYDLTIQPDLEGFPNERQLRGLLQQVLAERFGVTLHREQRELPAYALTVANGGPKLTTSGGDPNGLPGLTFRGLGVLPATNATMANLAGLMQATVLDRPVVDRTGLTGRYDFVLKWTPDESQFRTLGAPVPPPTDDPNAPPGLFTAIQEQLGLHLDSTKAPVEVQVIDTIRKPTDN